MKTTHQIAYNYCMAMQTQQTYEAGFTRAMQMLNPDNHVFGLADPLEAAYSKLVVDTLGPELMEWIYWWMYETEYGTNNMEFQINNISYDPTTMTLYRFLELVDASA
jgi:hypothetical protein